MAETNPAAEPVVRLYKVSNHVPHSLITVLVTQEGPEGPVPDKTPGCRRTNVRILDCIRGLHPKSYLVAHAHPVADCLGHSMRDRHIGVPGIQILRPDRSARGLEFCNGVPSACGNVQVRSRLPVSIDARAVVIVVIQYSLVVPR